MNKSNDDNDDDDVDYVDSDVTAPTDRKKSGTNSSIIKIKMILNI